LLSNFIRRKENSIYKSEMKYFIWRMIHLIVFLIILAGLLLSVVIVPWFSQGEGASNWEGGLLSPYGEDVYDEDKTYSELAEDSSGGVEEMFDNLWIGGMVYLILTAFSCLLILVVIILLICQRHTKVEKIFATVVLVVISLGCQLAGFISWATLSKVDYEEDCEDLVDGEDPAPVCAEEGSMIALAVLLLLGVATFLHCCLWCCLRRER